MTDHGHFHWNELMTRDTGKARKFYGDTLGWTYDPMPMGDGEPYYVCKAGGDMVGGIFAMTDGEFSGVPEHWMGYIAVDDIDARVRKARDAGGEILREPWDIPGVGRIAIVKDPSGAVSGWMTPSD